MENGPLCPFFDKKNQEYKKIDKINMQFKNNIGLDS